MKPLGNGTNTTATRKALAELLVDDTELLAQQLRTGANGSPTATLLSHQNGDGGFGD